MSVLSTSPANDLNKIGMFEEKGVRLLEQHLGVLAKLFIDYKMNESYAIGYLHRHFDIAEPSIWVHERSGSTDNVVPKSTNSINMSNLQAHSYCLEDGSFKAFEYEGLNSGVPRQHLTTDFLSALKEVLEKYKLENIVSLCPREKQVMFETLLNHEGGTTASPVSIKPIGDGMTTETAQWCFDASASTLTTTGEAVPIIKSQRECWVNRDGFHFVNGDNEANPLAGQPVIKSQRECWINRDGFHFVNDKAQA